MSQTKAQLIEPIGVVTASGVVVSGVMTAATFDGDVVGSATSIIQGTNLNVGAFNASSFAGDFTGNATGIITSSAIKVGQFTASSFVGDFTGTATSMFKGTGFTAGDVNAQGFVADVTGNVTGDVTGNIAGNVTGNVTGSASGHAGGLGVSYNGGWTGAGTSQISVGVMTATSFHGDGSTLTGVSGGPVSAQSVTIDSASTTIDLSSGNLIYASQSSNTTVSFANSENGDIYIVRAKDNNDTPRTITWPGSVSWDGGSAPTLITDGHAGDVQIFNLLTRDDGVTWYGKEVYKIDFIQGYSGWVFGGQSYGEFGTNNVDGYSSPKQVGGATDWNAVSQGVTQNGYMYLWRKKDGGLYGAGRNTNRSELGQNARSPNYSSPVQIGTDVDWSGNITGGTESSAAVKTTGELFMWGNNEDGMLGLNDRTNRSSPTQVGTDTTWSTAHNTLATHNTAGVAIKTDGTLWSWGNNSSQGRLGQGNNTQYSSPTQVGTDTTWSTVGHSGISGAALKTNGTLWTWGYNEDNTGQLGHNNQTNYSSPKQVGTETTWSTFSRNGSSRFMAAIKTDGTLWAWGRNNWGQLGINQSGGGSDPTSRSSPTQVGTDTTWWQVRVGNSVCAAVKTDGTLWKWGYNASGQLGHNNKTNYSSPMQVGTDTNWKTTAYGFGQGNDTTFILRSS